MLATTAFLAAAAPTTAVANAEGAPGLAPLALSEDAAAAFGRLLRTNPGLDSALIVLRASRVCRGVRFAPEEVNDALSIVTGAMSPTFRDDPTVSRERLEREQIDGLADNELAFESLRRAQVNCFDVEPLTARVRADLQYRGRPLSLRLARVMQQGAGAGDSASREPTVHITVNEAPRPSLLQMLLPWNW